MNVILCNFIIIWRIMLLVENFKWKKVIIAHYGKSYTDLLNTMIGQ